MISTSSLLDQKSTQQKLTSITKWPLLCFMPLLTFGFFYTFQSEKKFKTKKRSLTIVIFGAFWALKHTKKHTERQNYLSHALATKNKEEEDEAFSFMSVSKIDHDKKKKLMALLYLLPYINHFLGSRKKIKWSMIKVFSFLFEWILFGFFDKQYFPWYFKTMSTCTASLFFLFLFLSSFLFVCTLHING